MVSAALRRVLLRYLAAGLILEHEAARLAGTTKQAVHKWCRAARIDLRSARAKRVWAYGHKIREEVHHTAGIEAVLPRAKRGRYAKAEPGRARRAQKTAR